MSKHIMLDLETLDNSPTSYILELAAVEFDPITGKIINELHLRTPREEPQDKSSASVSTILWWLQTNSKKFEDLCKNGDETRTLSEICAKLRNFFYTNDGALHVWCTGTFDTDIINHFVKSYSHFGTSNLVEFWQMRDVRTARTLARELGAIEPEVSEDELHSALNDCRRQIQYVSGLCKLVKRGG